MLGVSLIFQSFVSQSPPVTLISVTNNCTEKTVPKNVNIVAVTTKAELIVDLLLTGKYRS